MEGTDWDRTFLEGRGGNILVQYRVQSREWQNISSSFVCGRLVWMEYVQPTAEIADTTAIYLVLFCIYNFVSGISFHIS